MYTPGLTVSSHTTITKTRRLPLKGQVLVEQGARVAPDTVVARALLPGLMQTVKAASLLGVDPPDVPRYLLAQVGDTVQKGQVVARSRALWGLMTAEAKAGISGTVEIVSNVTGNVGIREAPHPLDVSAYIPGTITDVLPGEGVTVSAQGALVQGIFGVGGERRARIKRVTQTAQDVITDEQITPSCAGCVLVGGANLSLAALRKASEIGVLGIIAGGIVDSDLVAYLGYDIGVAITGHEDIPLTLVLTEGFGTIAMAQRTFDLLCSLDGREASFSGATQIRAGVIRPEIIVADNAPASVTPAAPEVASLAVGTPIRLIREPYFGQLATVTGLPSPLVKVDSGAYVRVLTAQLATGETVTVPRANVEIISMTAVGDN